MKIKRHKKFQRNVKYFIKHFDWKPPFHLLIDGTIAKAALDNRVNLRDQFPKYFDNPIRLVTSPCCIVETEAIGPELYGALQILKSCHIHKCPHGEVPISAGKCMKSLCGAEHVRKVKGDAKEDAQDDKEPAPDIFRFIPGTQDSGLRRQLRQLAGVPLVYLKGAAPTFERPSQSSQDAAVEKGAKKLEVVHYQKEILDRMKAEAFGNPAVSGKKGTRKRKRAGPNPLSCKKAKTNGKSSSGPSQPESQGQSSKPGETGAGTKKKRKRNKVPKHVKQELARMKKNNNNQTQS